MRFRSCIFIGIFMLAALQSCQWLSSIVHDEEVVAKLGKHRLYRPEVEAIIPKGTSHEDSLNMAMLYINSWATDMAFVDVAEKELTKDEKDVAKELEQYKESLLRYRYEQRYVNERLDTTITDAQIYEYYKSHKESYVSQRALAKARYLNIQKKSSMLSRMKKLMSSDNVEDVIEADSLAANSSLNYHDLSTVWMDAENLALQLGLDYEKMKPLRKGAMIEIPDGENVSLLYIVDVVDVGEAEPVEYVRGRLKDNIISARKHELLTNLEQDLLENAKVKENFVIYSK